MKLPLSRILVSVLACAMLAGCAGKPGSLPVPGGAEGETQEGLTLRCRVVSADADQSLLLADVDADGSALYTLDAGTLAPDGAAQTDEPLSAGALVELTYSGNLLETYPARFADVTSLAVLPDAFDDRCALYLRALDDLWNADAGLNGDVSMVSVDLSATALTPAERSAVAWLFAQSHGAVPLELSYEQLCEDGYIGGLTDADAFPAWEDGILFTIAETDAPDASNPLAPAQYGAKSSVTFDAEKWRSALGAYGFSQCTATQDRSGAWGDYSINGGEWIS